MMAFGSFARGELGDGRGECLVRGWTGTYSARFRLATNLPFWEFLLAPILGGHYSLDMRIIAYKTLREHWEKLGRSDSREPLVQWFAIAEKADWAGPAQLKDQFRSASFVGDRVVFNIAGNKYRLVTVVKYPWRMVYIRFVGTHAEYDELNRTGKLESI